MAYVNGLKKVCSKWLKEITGSAKVLKRITTYTEGGAGRRIYPSNTTKNNETPGLRIDQGQQDSANTELHTVVLQANKEAKNSKIKEFIKDHGTHAKVATAKVSTATTAQELHDELISDFEARAGRNWDKK